MKTFVYYNNCYCDGPGNALLACIKATNEISNFYIIYENISDEFRKSLSNNVSIIKINKQNKHTYLNIQKNDNLICWVHTKKIVKKFTNIFKNILVDKSVMIHQSLEVIKYFNRTVRKNTFDKYLFCGEDIKNIFLTKYPSHSKKTFVITNTLDFDKINKNKYFENELHNFNNNTKKIISIGGLRKQKNYLKMLNIIKKLNSFKVDFQLFIIGDGIEKSKIKKFITNNQIKNVILMGKISNPLPYLKMSDIYFSTSNHEGLSISVLEAMYLKKHLVLSNCPGNKEINAACSFSYGFEINDEDSAVRILRKLLEKSSEILNKTYKDSIEYISYNKVQDQFKEAFCKNDYI